MIQATAGALPHPSRRHWKEHIPWRSSRSIQPPTKSSTPSRRRPPRNWSACLPDGHDAFLDWRARPFAERSARMHEVGPPPSRAEGRAGPHDDARDGQAHRPVGGRGRQVRRDLRLLRRACRALPRRPAPRDGRGEELRALRPARHHPRRDAVELPLLAGLPLRRSGADGRQCRPAQARLERPAVRPRDRGHLQGRRLSPRALPHRAHRVIGGRRPDRGCRGSPRSR